MEQRIDSLESRMPYVAICPAKPEEPLQESEQDKRETHDKEKDVEDIDLLFGSYSKVSK